jgi:internalin A
MDDRAIVAQLKATLGITGGEETYDEQGRLIGLDLSKLDITYLPGEVGLLSNLLTLDLNNNQLTRMPIELAQLTSLEWLNLGNNQLIQVPVELAQLTTLQTLDLWSNQLTQIPVELARLTNLRNLDLSSNQLTQIPVELAQLTNLQELDLSNNQLTQIPVELAQLTNLQMLDLSYNRLKQIPVELAQLTNLEGFYLSNNQLTHIPVQLARFYLQELDLSHNQLTQVPVELAQLTQLQTLLLNDNADLLTPPPEIVAQGTREILAFLRELQRASFPRYEAKVLLVGEGGTGKSSLLRALRGQEFEEGLDTTHGIAVESLPLPRPQLSDKSLTLNVWDFGGQDIYHATHQFFLTKRSVYVVVWNARTGSRDSKLDYWLDTIHVLAPDAPVLLVATHIDERAPDLNVQQYRSAYPQIVAVLSVNNKEGDGIKALKIALARHAAALPLVGQPWPTAWVHVEQALLARPEHHISADLYMDICTQEGVQAEIAQGTLGGYLHDLGKVLYFRDDQILSNIVVLKPNWVTKAISLVLEDPATRAAHGILVHADLPRIWALDEDRRAYARALYPIFLRLMERFDLSYQIEPGVPGQSPTHSLIPQLLPYQEPAEVQRVWPPDSTQPGQMHVEMVYRFDFVPAGIMSWFIVRTHRYTRKLHWRDGAILSYEGHLARIELFPMLRELRIVVWGIQPYTFFVILKETLDLILTRFAGLQVRREVPCTCQSQTGAAIPCREVYRYEEDLLRHYEHKQESIKCRESFQEVPVLELLYGIHSVTTPQVVARIETNQEILRQLVLQQQKEDLQSQQLITLQKTIDQLVQQVNLSVEGNVRNFTRLWNLEMQRLEAECPNTFFLIPEQRRAFNPKKWIGYKYSMYLVCQHPPGPHIVDEAHGYPLEIPKEKWKELVPWLKRIITFLKFVAPLVSPLGGIVDAADFKAIDNQLKLLETLTGDIPNMVVESDPLKSVERDMHIGREQAEGAALRVLHSFLAEADKSHYWGGLQKVPTEDGNILWLCGEHARPYAVRELRLE